MANERLKRIAEQARSLASRAAVLRDESARPLMQDLSGLMEMYFPKAELDPELKNQITDVAKLGALISNSRQLAQKSNSMQNNEGPKIQALLSEVATEIEAAAGAGGSTPAVPESDEPSAPRRKAIATMAEAEPILRRIETAEEAAEEGRPIVVGRRWKIIKSLGKGGQGQAFLVSDERGEYREPLALKRLMSKKEKPRARFSQEVKVAKKLQHPGLIPILDAGLPPESTPFYVMPFMPNGDINAFVRLFRDNEVRVMGCFRRICEAVSAAHDAGIVHRDLKPENILFDQNWMPVVADFGICFDLMDDHERFTLTREKVGPRDFIAPELVDGQLEEIKPTSDIYSLGKLLWFMLAPGADKLLFHREDWADNKHNLWGLRDDIRMRFINEMIFVKTMVREPDKRFQNVGELMTQVDEVTKLLRDGFEPLGEGMRCRFCGRGKYQALNGAQLWFGFGPPIQNSPWRGLSCGACGNVQVFRKDLGADWLV
jgi:hypothetical protein